MSRAHADTRVSDQIRTLFQDGALGPLTDGQLLERYVSPDGLSSEMAFAALVERHGPMVLGVCRRLLSDVHVAEDAFQATFLVLARRARSVRNHDSLGGWLHRVARRIAMRLRSTHERRKARERPGNLEVAVQNADRVENDELKSVIDQEIDRLPAAHRMPVVLCCLEGISHEEAAQRLRWPLGTVKSRLARARKRLQERLMRRGFTPSVALAASGTGWLAGEASAAVPPALIDATAKAAAAVSGGASLAGMVPASLSAVVCEELNSMIASKLKLAVGIPLAATAASALYMGLVLAATANQKVATAPVIAAATKARDEPQGKHKAPAMAVKLSASGTVVDAEGRPVAQARVILREWSVFRVRGMSRPEIEKLHGGDGVHDTLMEIKTDDAGRFRFQEVPAPAFPQVAEVGQTVFPWDIVALAENRGLAWAPLMTQNQRTPITLKLGPEGILRGQVVEPGGKPVAGAKVQVTGIDPLGRPNENGLGTENRLNLSWSAFPLGATTNDDGRFTIRGLARDKVATLLVVEPHHERVFAFAATTDVPQPDFIPSFVRPGNSIRCAIYTGDFTITAKRADHILKGRVVREVDGKPAAKAHIIHEGILINADENGRFGIQGLVSGKLVLHASVDSSDNEAAPVAAQIDIAEAPLEIERDLILPRGLVVTGRVIDSASGQGVEKALVEFNLKHDANQTPTVFGFSKETSADGRFRLVVPPGHGTVVLRTFPTTFPQPERRFVGQPEDPKLSREVEGRGGQTIELADFQLARGREVVLRVINLDGAPIAGARVDIRDPNRPPNEAPGRSNANGRYAVTGLALDQSTVIDINDEKRALGSTIEVPEAAGARGGEVQVQLQPLMSLSGRVLDEEGKPLAGATVSLFRNVNYPGQSGRSFGVSIGTQHQVKDDGTYTFDQLIPGATYNTQVEVSGYPHATSAHVIVKPRKPIRLDDFRLPAADQEVSGSVVDARGKPLAAVSVSLERAGRTSSLYAPTGGVWFQDTDQAGRFHLTSLPRGPFRLMVYRNPAEAYQQIKGIKYVDIRPGQTEVRIEMPDDNDRLRGIE